MSSDNQALEAVLAFLAAQANLSTLQNGPDLPRAGWTNLSTFKSSMTQPPPTPPTQGFLSKGPVDGIDGQIAVLALGMEWEKFLLNHFDGFEYNSMMAAVNPVLGGGDLPVGALMDFQYQSAYLQLRNAIWTSFSNLNGLPLYVTGMGLAGPLAQQAVFDLRNGHKGPSHEDPPSVSGSYVFSTGNIANQVFASYFNSKVQNHFVVWAGNNALPVDQWPTAFESNAGTWQSLGITDSISNVKLPKMDVPWLERSDLFYLKALGGTVKPKPVIPPSISNPPAGYSQSLAYTLARLSQASYQLVQRHGSVTINISPYTFTAQVNSNGTPWAYVFESTQSVVVVFRGTTTWQEFVTYTANSNFSQPNFDENLGAHVHSGAWTIYNSPTDSGSATTFQNKLLDLVKTKANGKSLYITGHSLGGTLASIFAADLTMKPIAGITVESLYTFGALLVGDFDFSSDFNSAMGSKSYQIRRLNDKIPYSILTLGFSPLNNSLVLVGQDAEEESTFHALSGYLNMLDPN